MTATRTISHYRNDQTGELAPPHVIGTDENDNNLYSRQDGWTPVDSNGKPVEVDITEDASLARLRLLSDEERDGLAMPQRTTLDAMIIRADFALADEEYAIDLFQGFPISYLEATAAQMKLLRKPDFQRETNHWTPDQICTLISSFVDNEVIPSLILWRSPNNIFVIDGGHRLSALRAWMEDNYGDGPISHQFFGGNLSVEQKKIAKRTRNLISKNIGTYKHLSSLVDSTTASPEQKRRAVTLATRALQVQWVQGTPAVAETSFFKINSQGTALDEIEEMLIRNRKRAISISARAILRAGAGHKYWSLFSGETKSKIEELASGFYKLMFEPEAEEPLKTLDLPLGGSVSPVDALSLLIEFMTIAGSKDAKPKPIGDYEDDATGDETIQILDRSLSIVARITGNGPESLGLHPAVYFYNERGKYSRFLFLGMSLLISERVKNNDSGFFKKFTHQRAKLEKFLIENKSLIGILLQNMSKGARITKMRDMLSFLIQQFNEGKEVNAEEVIPMLGLRGRVIDVVNAQASPEFTDEVKSSIFIRDALKNALICPICKGMLDPKKSVSYDHVIIKREGGKGTVENGALVHPYCIHETHELGIDLGFNCDASTEAPSVIRFPGLTTNSGG